MADLTTEEIIREIAAKHSIAVGKDDPILIMFTAYELLFNKAVTDQAALLNDFRADVKNDLIEWDSLLKKISEEHYNTVSSQAKQLAEDVINKSLDASETRSQAIYNENLGALTKAFNDSSVKLSSDIDHKIKQIQSSSYLNIISSVIVFLAVITLIVLKI